MAIQYGLFGETVDHMENQRERLRSLAERLPKNLFLGTSSWAFPGWRGIVYSEKRSPTDLSREGLVEYSRHPLLRAVEIDRSYYAPVPADDLSRYSAQVPPAFRFCVKAPAIVTSAVLPIRTLEPEPNPDFLSAEVLKRDLLDPLREQVGSRLGAVILQFPPQPSRFRLRSRVFADRLDHFFNQLPRDIAFSVELRDPQLLGMDYREVLRKHGASHAYNFWSSMPMPEEQERSLPLSDATSIVMRLMLPPGTTYDGRREDFRPFDRLHEPHPEMRRQVVALARRALREDKKVYILANNKAEGSTPLTLQTLAELLAETE